MTPVDFCFPQLSIQDQMISVKTSTKLFDESGGEFLSAKFWLNIDTHRKREKIMFLIHTSTLGKRQIIKIKSWEKEMCAKVLQHHSQLVWLWWENVMQMIRQKFLARILLWFPKASLASIVSVINSDLYLDKLSILVRENIPNWISRKVYESSIRSWTLWAVSRLREFPIRVVRAESYEEKWYFHMIYFSNGPRLCERPGSPLNVVEFRTESGDFKLQQNSASAKIFTKKRVRKERVLEGPSLL